MGVFLIFFVFRQTHIFDLQSLIIFLKVKKYLIPMKNHSPAFVIKIETIHPLSMGQLICAGFFKIIRVSLRYRGNIV